MRDLPVLPRLSFFLPTRMVYRSARETLPKLSVQALSRISGFFRTISFKQRIPTHLDSISSSRIVQEEVVPKLDNFIAMDQRSPPPPPPPAPPVPYNALFSGMQYDPPPPTPTESSNMLSGMQYDPSTPTLTGSLSMQHNRQVPTPTLHVPQTMRYEQSVGPVAGRYRAKFQTSPAGLTRRNYEFITAMIDSEGPLPTNSSLALANTRAATYYSLVTAHAATIDFGGYWPTELKGNFESALWHKVGRLTRSGRCFNEIVEINGGRTFHCWVERVPEDAGLGSGRGENVGVGAGRSWGYF